MRNPMVGQLGQNQMLGQIRQMMQIYKSMGNPAALLKTAMANNDELKTIVTAANGDYKKAFYDLAQKRGVDPEEIINEINRECA